MRRFHLFEFNDLRWLPRFMTAWMTRIMRLGHMQLNNGNIWAPKFIELLDKSDTLNIVDLCSGGGGPILDVVRILEDNYDKKLKVTLTDILPNLQSAADINQDDTNITYITESIDATNVPKELTGVRTVFSGYHHLKEEIAFSFLKNAFESNQCIFIAETTQRSWIATYTFGIKIKYFFPMTRYIEPTRAQMFFTFIIPILPIMAAWDNIVSCIRTYTIEELQEFTDRLSSDNYRWEIGELESPKFNHPFTYLMGYPISNKTH